MDCITRTRANFFWRLLPIIVLFALIADLAVVSEAAAGSKTTYANRLYGFTLKYPSIYTLKTFGQGGFDLIKDGSVIFRADVEDTSFRIFIKESKRKENLFPAFARARAKGLCTADGPDGSSYCGAIESEKQYTSSNGLTYVEFYLLKTREDYSTHTRYLSRVGPVYAVDISRRERSLALMIFPGYGKSAPTSTELLMMEVVGTIKLAP